MKKLVATIAAVVACGSLFAEGNEVTWTGNGATAAWNDPDNWSAVPQEGDTAVFPEGTVTAAATDVDTFNLFGGFRIETGATLFLDQFNGTLSQPLSGDGTFLATGAAGTAKSLTITADNRAFTGAFAFTNNYVKLDSPYGLGTTNDVYVKVSLASCFIELMSFAPSILSNTFIVAGNSSRHPIFYNHNKVGGVTLAGRIHCAADQCVFQAGSQSGTAYGIDFSGGVTGSGSLLTTNSGRFTKITGEPVCMTVLDSFVSSANPNSIPGSIRPYSVSYAISTEIRSGYLNAESANFRFDAPKCSTRNAHWGFGMSNSSSGSGGFDLNGCDQDCGNFAYLKLPTETDARVWIKSEQEATLTMHGQMQYQYQSSSDPVDKKMRFPGLINGAVTFVLDSDLFDTAKTIRFIGTGSTTSGGLVSSKGTIEVLSMASFPNLTLLSAENVGKMKIETVEIGTEGKGLTVKASDSATMTINEGLVLQAKYAFLGGKWVEAGDYGGPDAGLDEKHTCANLAGTGIVRVAEYGGPKGLMLILK